LLNFSCLEPRALQVFGRCRPNSPHVSFTCASAATIAAALFGFHDGPGFAFTAQHEGRTEYLNKEKQMNPRNFALVAGIIMLAMGLFSLVPTWQGSIETLPNLNVETSYGLFLGLFPMNIFNKVALIVFGAAGIWAGSARFNSLPYSIWYARIVGVIFGVAAILGLFPQTDTLFGYWPLFRGEIVTHAVFSLLGLTYGFYLTSKVPDIDTRLKNLTPRGV
jgi:hypothetical protein